MGHPSRSPPRYKDRHGLCTIPDLRIIGDIPIECVVCGLWFVVCGLRSAAYGLLLNTLCCLQGGFKFRIATLSALCSCFFLSLSPLSVNFLSLFPCVLKIPVYCTHNMSAGTNQLWPSNVRGSFCLTWIIVFR